MLAFIGGIVAGIGFKMSALVAGFAFVALWLFAGRAGGVSGGSSGGILKQIWVLVVSVTLLPIATVHLCNEMIPGFDQTIWFYATGTFALIFSVAGYALLGGGSGGGSKAYAGTILALTVLVLGFRLGLDYLEAAERTTLHFQGARQDRPNPFYYGPALQQRFEPGTIIRVHVRNGKFKLPGADRDTLQATTVTHTAHGDASWVLDNKQHVNALLFGFQVQETREDAAPSATTTPTYAFLEIMRVRYYGTQKIFVEGKVPSNAIGGLIPLINSPEGPSLRTRPDSGKLRIRVSTNPLISLHGPDQVVRLKNAARKPVQFLIWALGIAGFSAAILSRVLHRPEIGQVAGVAIGGFVLLFAIDFAFLGNGQDMLARELRPGIGLQPSFDKPIEIKIGTAWQEVDMWDHYRIPHGTPVGFYPEGDETLRLKYAPGNANRIYTKRGRSGRFSPALPRHMPPGPIWVMGSESMAMTVKVF